MEGSTAARLPLKEDHRSTRRQELIDAAIASIAEHGGPILMDKPLAGQLREE